MHACMHRAESANSGCRERRNACSIDVQGLRSDTRCYKHQHIPCACTRLYWYTSAQHLAKVAVNALEDTTTPPHDASAQLLHQVVMPRASRATSTARRSLESAGCAPTAATSAWAAPAASSLAMCSSPCLSSVATDIAPLCCVLKQTAWRLMMATTASQAPIVQLARKASIGAR
jgi:hypothetical protein